MNKAPTFFKFFIFEINNIDMKIPVAFMQRMEQPFPEKVFLRDRHNNIWKVKVTKVGNYWYFVDGWDKFVDDNLLTTGDLMVFKYFCDGLFNVTVYGPSATEKNVVGPSKLEGHVEKHVQKSENNDIVYVDDHDEETKSKSCNYVFMRRDHDNDDDDDDDESDDSDYTLMRGGENEHNEVVQEQVNNDGAGVSGNTQDWLIYLYPKCYGMEIFEAGLAQQPRNPYFVTKIMLKRKSDLFIPMDVIKDYRLNLEKEIVLVDPSGREFHTKCRKWKNGRWVLSGGWRRLCRMNLVALEDSCICEFVQREGEQRLFLHISFVRANI